MSCSGADDAITAESPTSRAAAARTTESIVRRLRRPGSVLVNKLILQERSADRGCSSRLTLVAVKVAASIS
jgi:hypothetical protein